MKSYFKIHERKYDASGRYITMRETYEFFDDESFFDTRIAYTHASERASQHGRSLSVYRTPAVFGPWSTLPIIRGEFAPCTR